MISIKEKIYSKAFEDGVNYAIERMFAEEEDKKKKRGIGAYIGAGLAGTVAGGVGGRLIGKHIATTKYIPDPHQYGVDLAKNLTKDNVNFDRGSLMNPSKMLKEHGSKFSESTKRQLETLDKVLKIDKRSSRLGALVGAGVGTGAVALYRHMKNKKQDN